MTGAKPLQVQLEQRDPNGHAAAIASIDRAVLELGPHPARTDLVVITGNGAAKRESSETVIGWETMPEDYKAGRNLQVVEVILKGGGELIDALYASLWSDN